MSQLHFSRSTFRVSRPNFLANASLLRRLFLYFLPVPLLALAAVFAYTHHDVESALNHAIARNSEIQAHAMGSALSQVLAETRNQVTTLAVGSISLKEFEGRLVRRMNALITLGDLRFREAAFLGIGANANERALWLQDKGRMLRVPADQVENQPSSIFHFPGRQPTGHEVVLSSPTEVVYSLAPNQENAQTQVTLQVMRFTTPIILTDGSFVGYLVLSVDMDFLRRRLAAFSRPDTDGPAPLALFVDSGGWMLFQMELDGTAARTAVDSGRAGLRGDFGRAGYSQAFRPGADYYGYWSMINEIQKNRAGQFITRETPWNQGSQTVETVSYMPVTYSSGTTGGLEVIGGVVVLDPSFSATRAGEHIHLSYLVAGLAALLISGLSILWIVLSLRRSLSGLGRDIREAASQSQAASLPDREEIREVARLRAGVNEILFRLHSLEEERDTEYSLASARMEQRPVPDMPTDIPVPKDGIIGVSREMQLLRQAIRQAAKVHADILVMGETGTGKELVSRAIHMYSDHSEGPFITINCGALDEGLLMDSLFGHVKGAYTEAKQGRKGAFLAAEGGTLMLDEIGTASPKVQQALLRALSDRCIHPLGSDVSVPFNTRVIAATNADLREEVRKGTFREDLYFRLAVITIHTTPLREHKMDIPYLVMAFLNEAMAKSPSPRPLPAISRGALSALMHHHWPGNVRELRNTIFRTAAFCETGLILSSHLRRGADEGDTGRRARTIGRTADLPPFAHDAPDSLAQGPAGADRTRPHGGAPDSIMAEGDSCPWPPQAGVAQPDSRDRATDRGSVAAGGETQARKDGKANEAAPAPLSDGRGDTGSGTGQAPPDTKDEESSLSPRLTLLLPRLAAMGSFSRQEYQDMAGVSMRTAQYDLQELMRAGILRRQGKGPSLRYVMKDGERANRI